MFSINNLNQKETAVLEVIKENVRQKGYPPSVREIGKVLGFSSSSTVHGYLRKLEQKGYIHRDPTKPRAIELLNMHDTENEPAFTVPVLGRVAAGTPILAEENIEDHFPLPYFYKKKGKLFGLRVKGVSMIEAGILENDLLIVRQQSSAVNGDIVIALLEDEATVKRFYKEKDSIRLQPENSNMQPIIVKDAAILGKVIGLFRNIN